MIKIIIANLKIRLIFYLVITLVCKKNGTCAKKNDTRCKKNDTPSEKVTHII